MSSTPYGYWYMALEEVGRTLYRDDFTSVTETKAIRKAVLAPDESVLAYYTDGDNEAVTLTVLTDRHRVVIIRFTGDTARHVNVPLKQIRFLGGAVDGITTRATDVAGMHAAAFRFVFETAEERIDVTLPVSKINSVAGREETEFAQKLVGELTLLY
jgi:hypothetical protein